MRREAVAPGSRESIAADAGLVSETASIRAGCASEAVDSETTWMLERSASFCAFERSAVSLVCERDADTGGCADATEAALDLDSIAGALGRGAAGLVFFGATETGLTLTAGRVTVATGVRAATIGAGAEGVAAGDSLGELAGAGEATTAAVDSSTDFTATGAGAENPIETVDAGALDETGVAVTTRAAGCAAFFASSLLARRTVARPSSFGVSLGST